ncbi:hypothetical protein [Methylobacterium sp. B1]|uniref:hypothetical protein n=1 Tax=Methylobacterium sp. B1 TaxID=91459 RepID=UPI000349C8EB|nr:hypothetical protein [Methylobacterium sp. B1]
MPTPKARGDADEGKRLLDDLSDKYEKQRALAGKIIDLTKQNSGVRTWAEINTTGRPATAALRSELDTLAKGRSGETSGDELGQSAAGFQIRMERAWGTASIGERVRRPSKCWSTG